MSTLTVDNGCLVLRTPYNPGLVAALKAEIPAPDRRFEPATKAWRVAAKHAPTIVRLAEMYLGEHLQAPNVGATATTRETRIIEVRYIGATKDRGDGAATAFGLVSGQWSVVLPETVLREWFNSEARPDELPTLYAVLGVPAAAVDADIKGAYRRLARTWHPDVCREPDAKEQFQRIQHAYEVLREPASRAKYDAGRALEASLKNLSASKPLPVVGYRSPLRCGLIMAEGHEVLGRFVVEKIVLWNDIVNTAGQVLVTSWPAGADAPLEVWS